MEARIFNQPTENMSRHVSPFNDLDIEVRTECRNVTVPPSPRVLDSTTPRDSLNLINRMPYEYDMIEKSLT